MNNRFVKKITLVALLALISLQGIWLYNMYTFWNVKLYERIESVISESKVTESFSRFNKIEKEIPDGTILEGLQPEQSTEVNALYLNAFLTKHNFPFVINDFDSIFHESLFSQVGHLNYAVELLDSVQQVQSMVNHDLDVDKINGTFFVDTKALRIDNSQYLRVSVESPYKIIFQKMAIPLVASLILGILVIYCVFYQIMIIRKQDRIATIRKDFTHAMIHEMKSPITTILMGINALRNGKLDNNEGAKKQYFNVVTQEGEQLLTLSNKILTIAQFEEDKIKLSKSEVDIRALLESLIEKYKLRSEKQIQISVSFHDVRSIYADAEYIREVFNNLIDNAVKYSGESVKIEIVCTQDNQNTTISVKDNGIGISLKDQKRILEKFERVIDTRKKKYRSGFGLGLNYVYQVVVAHGGNVLIDSILNEYSEFTVIIPNKPEEDDKIVTD